jgi:hypothetical protein
MEKILPFKKLIVASIIYFIVYTTNVLATTFTVSNNSPILTAGSLTAAISSANLNPGKDTIVFTSNFVIINQGSLTISDSLVIDATTQASYPSSYVSISGNGADLYGLIVIENMELYGVKIGNFSTASVLVSTNKVVKIGAVNKGNIIQGNSVGLYLFASNNCSVLSNKFCIAEDGTTLLSAGIFGVYALNCNGGVIGASSFANGGNLFAQNNTSIALDNCTNISIIGNKIGSNAAGAALLGATGSTGIYLTNNSANNNIGTSSSGNQIVNMFARALLIDGGSNTNTIAGNYIGVNNSGLSAIPNNYGIEILNANKNLIGGNLAIERNIVSGNVGSGIFIHGTSRRNNIYNNYIGVGINGTTSIGNAINGIELNEIVSVVDSTNIGDVNKGNIIANNGSNGILLNGSQVTKNSILRNQILCNSSGGITLTNGANASKAAPVVTSANTCQISGTSAANDIIEIYVNHSCSGSQGRTFVGTCTANASGIWVYSLGGYTITDELTAIAIATNKNTSTFNTKFSATTCSLPAGSFPNNQCGYTTQTLSGFVNANSVIGATSYEFTFYPVGGSVPYATKISTTASISFATVTPTLQWGTLYDLRVRPIIGVTPGFYSPVCVTGLMNNPSIITNIGTSIVRPNFCVPNNMKLNGTIRCTPVTQASNYEFSITDNVTLTTQTALGNGVNLALSNVSPALIVGRTYNISVRARVFGFWGNFGPVKTINIASASKVNFVENNSEQNDKVETTIFPNPFTNQINISSNNSYIIGSSVQLFDICGKMILEEKIIDSQTIIDTQKLPSGVYFLRTNYNTPSIQKLIKY